MRSTMLPLSMVMAVILMVPIPVLAQQPPTSKQFYLTESVLKRAERANELLRTQLELQRNQQELDAARQVTEQPQKIVTATQKGIVPTQIEMGTAPSSSVVRLAKPISAWYVEGQALYLRPRIDSLQFANLFREEAGISNQLLGQEELTLEREGAFRIRAGHRFANGWDLSASYTRLRTDDDQAIDIRGVTDGSAIRPAPHAGLESDANYDFVQSEVEFDYDVGDLTFARGLSLDDRTTVTLFTGVRVASIDLDQNTQYRDETFGSGPPDRNDDRSNDFLGGGPRFGGKASYKIGWGVGVSADVAGSLLIGRSRVRLNAAEGDPPQGSFGTVNAREKDTILVPVLEARAGIDWKYSLSQTSGLRFSLGYEFENWFGLDRQLIGGGENTSFNVGLSNLQTRDITLDGPSFRLIAYW